MERKKESWKVGFRELISKSISRLKYNSITPDILYERTSEVGYPPVLGQIAAIGALDTPQQYIDDVRAEYIRRRDYMIENLNRIPGVYTPLPMGAFYTVAELPVDDTEKFARWMLEEFRLNGETTMVTPAASFFKTPGKGINYARIAYVLEIWT